MPARFESLGVGDAYRRAYTAANYRLRTFSDGRWADRCRPTDIGFLMTNLCKTSCGRESDIASANDRNFHVFSLVKTRGQTDVHMAQNRWLCSVFDNCRFDRLRRCTFSHSFAVYEGDDLLDDSSLLLVRELGEHGYRDDLGCNLFTHWKVPRRVTE